MFDYDEKPELNITPLVDIMLVLLAILMVTTPAVIYEEQILLPDGSKKTVSSSKKDSLIIVIDDKKKIKIDNKTVNLDEFSDSLVLISSKYNLDDPVFVMADKNLIYNDVMYVLKTLKLAGFTKVALQTAG
ncbi:biopolymer transporter ExbD [Campylobacter sp. FMV-PI01]|uniref:Biopolymer transporter ExbD n=1 Tax=Campylobacter portucalensis TaxID=2608384 RepID=A0A6L5WLT4_9BACT|nr:biopolymer transporter ExbD [Campylobacter portucalensis]MSN96641.1 biopolymer transporter ExbD [Campylobacter portucalensis]